MDLIQTLYEVVLCEEEQINTKMLGSTFVISLPQSEKSGKFSMHQELISEQMLFLSLEEMH